MLNGVQRQNNYPSGREPSIAHPAPPSGAWPGSKFDKLTKYGNPESGSLGHFRKSPISGYHQRGRIYTEGGSNAKRFWGYLGFRVYCSLKTWRWNIPDIAEGVYPLEDLPELCGNWPKLCIIRKNRRYPIKHIRSFPGFFLRNDLISTGLPTRLKTNLNRLLA